MSREGASRGRKSQEQELAARIGALVRSWGTAERFEPLALDLFAYQYAFNRPYARFCDSLGRTPRTVNRWDAIPAAPSDAFRLQPLRCDLGWQEPGDASRWSTTPPGGAVFETSGTTGGRSGQHWMNQPALELYALSLETAFARLAPGARGLPIVALVADWQRAPRSSLSYMVSRLAGRGSGGEFCWRNGGPDVRAAAAALRTAKGPVLLFTTAFALVALLEHLEKPLSLPAGSVVIETGGFKGRTQEVSRDELYREVQGKLGADRASIGAEYGMCEMASQFYDRNLGGAPVPEEAAAIKIGPPWVRTVVMDPVSGAPAAEGASGMLVHYDLCNLNSVLAVATLDMARQVAGGFELLGRLPGAALRGCSLTVEEWQQANRG